MAMRALVPASIRAAWCEPNNVHELRSASIFVLAWVLLCPDQGAGGSKQTHPDWKCHAAPTPADGYAECYPSYYDYGTMMADSDEEGGVGMEQVGGTRG